MTVLRGATTITSNNTEEMQSEVLQMFEMLVKKNDLDLNQICCIIFACTKDLTCANPATCLRKNIKKVADIPLLCFAHHEYEGSLKLCIRIMLMTNQKIDKIQHIYLNNAKVLREDLNDKYSN